MIVNLRTLKDIAEIEYGSIVEYTVITDINTMRILFYDGSYLDVWFSLKLEGRYSYHWERRHIDGTLFRHDNAPHMRWRDISTFPKHFHDGSEENVRDSDIPEQPENGIRYFLHFIREKRDVKE